MKTTELTGRALDHAVALADGMTWHLHWPIKEYDQRILSDFVEGSAGDDIIDREKINTWFGWNFEQPEWVAEINASSPKHSLVRYGATRREAAMRVYVALKLGAEVDIPKELL